MKSKWLPRATLYGPYVQLVTSQSEYRKALRDLNISDDSPYVPEGWPACTHKYRSADGEHSCIVGLNMDKASRMAPIDVAALLVHEAVHVWQFTEMSAGGTQPFGDEGEAYGIQNISTSLMEAYVEKLK